MAITTKPLIGSKSNECLICEHSNDVEYWDTGRYLDLQMPNKHEGRKFVCRDCIADAAREFGFQTPEAATVLTDRAAYVETQLVHLTKVNDLVQVVKDAADTIAAGYPGQSANAAPVVVESKPDTKKVKGAKIVDTTTPEASVTEDGRTPVADVTTAGQ